MIKLQTLKTKLQKRFVCVCVCVRACVCVCGGVGGKCGCVCALLCDYLAHRAFSQKTPRAFRSFG